MARVSIFYDNDIKERVFMVRGDERYARATKTILTLGSHVEHITDFDQTLSIEVLKDTGDGSVLIYDNDVLIYRLDDWTNTDGVRTITLEELNYDIEHNFQAEYISKNKSQRSKSNVVTTTVEDTHKFASNLTITGDSQFRRDKTNVQFDVLLSNAQSDAYSGNQTIYVYYDDTLVDTVTTSNESGHYGEATITIPDVKKSRLHTIRCEYLGSQHLYSKTATKDISVGYNVEMIECTPIQIAGNTYDFKCKVLDFFGNPVSDMTVYLYYDGTEVTHKNTDANGIVTVNSIVNADNTIVFFTAKKDLKNYSSNDETVHLVTPPLDLHLVAPDNLYQGEIATFSINTGSSYVGIPVEVSVNEETTTVYTTDNTGIVTYNITGVGRGSKSVTFTLGNISNYVTKTDYSMYLAPMDLHPNPPKLTTYNGNFATLNNMLRLVGDSSGMTVLHPSYKITGDCEFIVEITSTNKNCIIGLGMRNPNTGLIEATYPSFSPIAHNNQQIKIVSNSSQAELYIDGVKIDTKYPPETIATTFNDYYPCLIVGTANTEVNISKITYRGL